MDLNQQIKAIEDEIRKTPYHKGTERHHGILRARLSKLKAKREAAASRGSSGRGIAYAVKKQGDATVTLVGPPSAGKSTLINKLTNANSRVAPYEFTTVSVIPGIMKYRDANIQILDVPGLIEGAEEGKGRGREVISVVRASDLLVLISDIARIGRIEHIKAALERNGIRINKNAPDVTIDKKVKGGVQVHTNIKQEMGVETIKEIAREMGLKNGEVTIRQKLDMEELVDAFSGNRVYINAIEIVNKVDEDAKGLSREHPDKLFISAEKDIGLDALRESMWEKLALTRIFLVRQDGEPSKENPMIVPSDSKLTDVAEMIGTEFAQDRKKAKIWGSGAKFAGQIVSLNSRVRDGMQVRFV